MKSHKHIYINVSIYHRKLFNIYNFQCRKIRKIDFQHIWNKALFSKILAKPYKKITLESKALQK